MGYDFQKTMKNALYEAPLTTAAVIMTTRASGFPLMPSAVAGAVVGGLVGAGAEYAMIPALQRFDLAGGERSAEERWTIITGHALNGAVTGAATALLNI